MVEGYKCFNSDLTNRYGEKFEVGKVYSKEGTIKFGNDGNGFHICANLEDTLRYFDGFNEIKIAKVILTGTIVCHEDEYNGYYDMYAGEYLYIEKVLTRQEIIDYALSLSNYRINRFISLFRLNEEEIKLFKEKFKNDQSILDTIAYYQENDHNVYKKKKSF